MSPSSETEAHGGPGVPAPFPHQQKVLDWAEGKRHVALFAEPGTGKSRMILDFFASVRAGGVTHLVIVCPKVVIHQWLEQQLPLHSPDLPRSRVLVTNYEQLLTTRGQRRIAAFVKGRQFCVAFDESHRLKSPFAQRTRQAFRLASRAAAVVVATGTPLAKDLVDEYSQLNVLKPGILPTDLDEFQSRYCIMGGYKGVQVIGQQNLREYRRRTDPYVYRLSQEDVGICEAVYSTITFDLAPEQQLAYDALAGSLSRDLEDLTQAEIGIRLLRLRQAASGFTETGRLPDNARLDTLVEYLDALGDAQVLVWVAFREDANIVSQRLSSSAVATGAVSLTTRQAAVDRWLSGRCQYLIATPEACGVGLNLQRDNAVAVFYSHGFSYGDRVQAEARTHRIGSTGVSSFVSLVARGTLDRMILNCLERKSNFGVEVFSARR